MKNLKKSYVVLIVFAILLLVGCIGMTGYLFFSNYQTVRLFKQAQNNFQRGDGESLSLAEAQLLQLIRKDSDNESAYVMLGEIAEKRKIYPEQVYYSYMAHRLNPLSEENKDRYVRSLWFARYFDRLENFLSQQQELQDRQNQILLYAAGHNGNINKYKHQLKRRNNDNRIGELAFLLFKYSHLSNKDKLAAIDRFKQDDVFFKQEILAGKTELYLAMQDFDNAEKTLLEVYELNPFAFGPVLGKFYASYRNFGKALKIFEKHLAIYHDPMVAMYAAEIYCLLKQTDKIDKLRSDFQADSGNIGMLCCYYFDALNALAKNDMTSLKELTVPLRKSIDTPLSAFMFFCADIQGNDLAAIKNSYTALLAHRNYLNLQEQSDKILLEYLKNTFAKNSNDAGKLVPLAEILYRRKPDVFAAKLILLAQKKSNSVNIVLLKDALKRFGNDSGIVKIAIEYYLKHELAESERLVAYFKKTFPAGKGDMLRYEIIFSMQKKDYEKVSALFRENFSPAILPEYWNFASALMREKDLLFLSRDKLYEPFCKALLAIKKNDRKSACDLLEKADAKGNLALLFFAAKTLAENGRNQSALDKYALFPANSGYYFAVLLNTAELFAENGELNKALDLAEQAYKLAPDMPEAQFCYADKLFRNGKLNVIPDIVKLSPAVPFRNGMEKLWIAGMQQRVKECDVNTQKEKIREICRQILVVDPDNNTALEYLKKLNKMPQ